ncbi:MAG: GNAT family N-acetyltransferase [Gammaproteobacteria bacterium]
MTMIKTERLILRPIDPERDFKGWMRAFGDEQTTRYLWGAPLDEANAWRNMAMVMGHWQIRGYGFFSLEDRETGEWVGRVGPWNPHGWPQPEVGWTISPDHLRRGYAVEAGRASIEYAFRELGWTRVVHVILEGNEASIGVAEKLGSTLIGKQDSLPGVTDSPVFIYGQDAK